ncbi:MAG: hypothetical protein P4L34_11120 [Paludibacter sp.]|nr:hypothetical protein [Paludibacter sp.]
MKDKQPSQILFITAGTLTILGAFAKLFDITYAPYIFSVGAGLLIYLQGKNAFDLAKAEKRQQRLARMGLLNSLMLGVGAYFMFTGSNSWVVMVLIYALSSFYQSFRWN